MMTRPLIQASLVALGAGLLVLAGAPHAVAQSAERLAQVDSNGDGAIAWQEMLDMRAATFERLDRNGDGFADASDSPRMGPMKSRFNEALATLQDADADGDGRISQAEMLEAPAPLFESGDTDGDKVLSAEELAALRETTERS